MKPRRRRRRRGFFFGLEALEISVVRGQVGSQSANKSWQGSMEAMALEGEMAQWEAQGLGIKWVTLLLDNQFEGPPDDGGAKLWKEQYGLVHSIVAADPGFSMVPGNSVGTPQLQVIDPRTMQVVHLQEGSSGTHTELENLAHMNKAAAEGM